MGMLRLAIGFGLMAAAAQPFVMMSIGQNAAAYVQASMQSMSNLFNLVVNMMTRCSTDAGMYCTLLPSSTHMKQTALHRLVVRSVCNAQGSRATFASPFALAPLRAGVPEQCVVNTVDCLQAWVHEGTEQHSGGVRICRQHHGTVHTSRFVRPST